MTKQRTLSILSILAAATALSSCVTTWNTGKRMQESVTTYTGADTTKPVGNVVYKAADGNFYMQAPEVTYKATSDLITMKGFSQQTQFLCDPDPRNLKNVEPTGRTVYVKVNGDMVQNAFQLFAAGSKPVEVDGIPAGSVAIPMAKEQPKLSPGFLGELNKQQDPGSKGKVLASLPLRYVADPLLDVVTNAVVCAVAIPSGVVVGVPSLISTFRQNQQLIKAATDNSTSGN